HRGRVGRAGEDLVGVFHRLGQGLLSGLEQAVGLNLLAPAEVSSVRMTAEGAKLSLADGRELDTRLLIMADGGRSSLPASLGIHHQRKDYGTKALVTQIRCDQLHGHWAYERFSSDGPIALLPLNKYDFAVVWTLSEDVVDSKHA
ncbi:MAG: 2-octaprenyl-6-methoxyphenyl hydroxylase, partial [Thalassolituus sp.]